MITIRKQKPHKALSGYVRKISIFESKGKITYKQKLTSSAFTYLSYNHKDIPISTFNNESIKPQKRLQIAGPKLIDNIFVEYDGYLFQILIEFTASGFYNIFHSSPSTVVNKLSDLQDYISAEVEEQLTSELVESKNVEDQVNILHEFLLDQINNARPPIDYIEKALQIIEENHGHINVNALVENLSIGKRQFNRKFQTVVGVSPKSYCKILQLHYVINLMQSKQYSSMQDISYNAEYYDQAHFANRFKELTGFTPNEFIKTQKHIALKYFTDLSE